MSQVGLKHQSSRNMSMNARQGLQPKTALPRGFLFYTSKPRLVCLECAETLLASFLALGDDSQYIESYCLGQWSAQ